MQEWQDKTMEHKIVKDDVNQTIKNCVMTSRVRPADCLASYHGLLHAQKPASFLVIVVGSSSSFWYENRQYLYYRTDPVNYDLNWAIPRLVISSRSHWAVLGGIWHLEVDTNKHSCLINAFCQKRSPTCHSILWSPTGICFNNHYHFTGIYGHDWLNPSLQPNRKINRPGDQRTTERCCGNLAFSS